MRGSDEPGQDVTRQDEKKHDKDADNDDASRQDETGGKARRGTTRQDETGRAKTRQDENKPSKKAKNISVFLYGNCLPRSCFPSRCHAVGADLKYRRVL